jgi:beta-glucosidase
MSYTYGQLDRISKDQATTWRLISPRRPFQDAVYAGAGSIMCAYNEINNSYACQNSKTQNGLLKEELGFQGFVVSDWGGQHAGVASALAGLDMAMPSSTFWGDNLTLAVTNGSVPESRVDDMAARIIATWYQMDQDDGFPTPGIGMPESLAEPHLVVNAKNKSSLSTIYAGAVEGHVLVKNDNALPLKDPVLLSLFGYAATVEQLQGPAPSSADSSSSGTIAQENYTMITGGGSGENSPAYISTPFDAITNQCITEGCSMYWDFEDPEPIADPESDACLVFVNAWATEGEDRPNLHDDYSDGIILSVAATCSNTIVIFQNAGVRLVDTFIEHPNITAVIFQHLPGQDSGRALAALLWGKENFSGKLPYSIPKNESDYGNTLAPATGEGFFEYYPQSNFTEGLYIDYRLFDENGTTPRYEFGYGLSYTTFGYSALSVSQPSGNLDTYPTGAVVEGGQQDLWDNLVTVTATVANEGSVAGAEVVQLYVGIPNAPAKQLRGFDKPLLQPNQSATVQFQLTRRDLSIWDVVAQKWNLQQGTYQVYVGSSSRIIPLTSTFTL